MTRESPEDAVAGEEDPARPDAHPTGQASEADSLDAGLDGLHHEFVLVADLPRAVRFYTRVVGAEPLRPDDPTASVETAAFYWLAVGSDTYLNLACDPDRAPLSETVEMVALGTTEAHARTVASRLADRGRPYEWGTNTLRFDDPSGNEVELTWWDGPR